MSEKTVVIAGSGGLGRIGLPLAQIGVGTIVPCDFDAFDATNSNRQLLRCPDDIGRNKAHALGELITKLSMQGTRVQSFSVSLEALIERGLVPRFDCLLACVDNDDARLVAQKLALEHSAAAVFMGLTEDDSADVGYIFAHEPGRACLVCHYPSVLEGGNASCDGVAATALCAGAVTSIGAYATGELLLGRDPGWNHRIVSMRYRGRIETVERRRDCPLCGGG